MSSALVGFGIAVGATSALCYVLMTRVERRRARSSVSGSSDGGLSDSWSFTGWSGGEGATDGSCSFSDGGGDGGGGCDGGGSGGGD
jgi:hypothetical protein